MNFLSFKIYFFAAVEEREMAKSKLGGRFNCSQADGISRFED